MSAAVAALKAGASDFVQRPFDAEEVVFALNKALTVVQMRAEHPPPPSSHERAGIVGDSRVSWSQFGRVEVSSRLPWFSRL